MLTPQMKEERINKRKKKQLMTIIMNENINGWDLKKDKEDNSIEEYAKKTLYGNTFV